MPQNFKGNAFIRELKKLTLYKKMNSAKCNSKINKKSKTLKIYSTMGFTLELVAVTCLFLLFVIKSPWSHCVIRPE